jgi:hypothetical protein
VNSIYDVLHRLVDATGAHFRDDAERAHEIIAEADPVKPAPPRDPEAELAALKAQVDALTAAAAEEPASA